MGITEKLETMVRGAGTLVRGAAYTGVALASSLAMTSRAYAETIPADFFATTDAKKIQLADYDSVAITDNWDNYYSSNTASKGIRWNDGTKTNVPAGYRVWVLDADNKPCGLYDIATAGSYGLLHAYQDDSTTALIDEGADSGDIMKVLVEKKDTGTMYSAQFVDSSYNPISITFLGDKLSHKADILVSPTAIPEASTLVLIVSGALAGAGVAALKKRK